MLPIFFYTTPEKTKKIFFRKHVSKINEIDTTLYVSYFLLGQARQKRKNIFYRKNGIDTDLNANYFRLYQAKNSPTQPQERIHKLTNKYPNEPRSPFYGREPIKPLATIVIKRLHPKTADECVEDVTIPDDPEENLPAETPEDMERKKAMMSGLCRLHYLCGND